MTMSAGQRRPAGGRAPEIDETAAEWLAKRDRGFTAPEERALAEWLAARPEHAAAWRECEAGWVMLDAVRERGWGGDLQRALAQRQQRRRVRRVTAALAGCGVAAALALMFFPPAPSPSAKPAAGVALVAQSEQRVLADGSTLTLEPGAQIEVAFTAAKRAVRLMRGEARFGVAKDPARPFVVSGGGVEVWAVGTAFSVEVDARAVELTVTEGKVAVNYARSNAAAGAAPAADHLLVLAGNRLHVPTGARAMSGLQMEALPAQEVVSRPAPSRTRVEFSDTPLREVVALLNRESAVKVTIADSSLGELRLGGVFLADDAETLARLLEANYGVSAERTGERIVLRRK